jgi:kynurenine formamidase
MHFVRGGASVDQVPLEPLIGPARVVDIPDSVQAIDAAELARHEWRGAQRLIFRTRSTLRGWMASPTLHRDFAYVAPDAARLLADAGVLLVGIDYISAEQFGAPAPEAHRILLGKGIPIVEGLALAGVSAGEYDLIVLPIKVAGHEGAPARAVFRRRATVGARVERGDDAAAAPPAATPDSTIFADEFSGTALDRAKWTVYTGQVYNSELQRYVDRAENLYIARGADAEGASDGALVIRARHEPGAGPDARQSDFTSGRLHGRVSFQYGTVAARMKLPAGAGLWPAF